MQRAARMKRELQLFEKSPPHGITCFPKEDSNTSLEAQILGPEGSPYEKGTFKLDIQLPERYPFEPPKISFVTPIYHPNIDNAGRICLDSLKMPPKGAWKPALNICTVLTSIQLLMFEPNPEDPLMTDIANEFKYHRDNYNKQATEHTLKHAVNNTILSPSAQCENKVESKPDSSSESSDESDSDDSTSENTPLQGRKTLVKKRPSGEGSTLLKENVKRLKDNL